ncbi:unnamed protein product [Amoebophrya sp. A25]|nr:unnamed protein product [Amoebophrya sp. A25]|eukprot:GSA25T00011402001.1
MAREYVETNHLGEVDGRMPDMRPARTLEHRFNTYGHRPWADTQCGMKDSLNNCGSGAQLEATEWLKKWTQPVGQQFGWRHFRDADEWRTREQAPPPPSNSGKRLHYHYFYGDSDYLQTGTSTGGGSTSSGSRSVAALHPIRSRGTDTAEGVATANATMDPKQLLQTRTASVPAGLRRDAPQFPQRYNWKTNAYGTRNPARQAGGISSWQPSHVDVLWGYPKGMQKWNKGTETQRILHPAPTSGVLQSRHRV